MFGNPILDLVFAPWAMNALFAAARLKIFDLLARGGLTAEELAERTGAHAQPLTALLDACVCMGLLRLIHDRYVNSHLSDAHLVEGRPQYVGNLIEIQAADANEWAGLYDLISTGEAPSKQGKPWEVDPHRFTLGMHNLGMLGEADALADAVDLSDCRTMVDVGAGSGLYSITLCRRNPNLRATLLDVAEVLMTARQIVAENGLGDRIKTRDTDIRKGAYGENLDVVLLSDVLYQDSATCMTMIRSAHRALAPGGKLLVRGYFCDPGGAQPLFGSLFILGRQLTDPKRQIISVPLLRDWVRQAGFANVHTFALTSRSTCLTASR